jgi:5-oxoprolinase (ATP-hydrolysing)
LSGLAFCFDAAVSLIWNFAIDRGGTFTDIVATRPTAGSRVEKLLSENPVNMMMPRWRASAGSAGEGGTLGDVRMGTTVATNALLERKGERPALAITAGSATRCASATRHGRNFRTPHRPARDALRGCVEIEERSGRTARSRPLTRIAPRRPADPARKGFDALAIVLMHGWRFTDHESGWRESPASSALPRFRSAMRSRR